MHRLQDDTLRSIAQRSISHGPTARRLLERRIEGLEEDTDTLTELTERVEADNATVRPLLAGGQQDSDEDAALSQLREEYGA